MEPLRRKKYKTREQLPRRRSVEASEVGASEVGAPELGASEPAPGGEGSTRAHSVPTSGNDLLLVIVGAAAGLLLGTGCGLATAVFRRGDGAPVPRAGALAAGLWVAGVGSRLAFSLYAQHGGGPAIGRFMIAHQITTGQAWVACLVLMALVEVVSRTAVLGAKYAAPSGPGRGAARSLGGADVPAQLS